MAHTNILLESGTNELEIVEFYITERDADGKEYVGYYGVNVAKVLEIIRMPMVTELPEAVHPCMLGAFNLRRKIVPLLDLSVWLGKDMVRNDTTKVIVTEFNEVTNSFLVSGVTRIHRLSWEQVEPSGQHLIEFSEGSVTGVVKFEDRIIMLLDMEKIVAELNPQLDIEHRITHARHVIELPADRPIKVLFADDSTMIRKTMERGLTKVGFQVEAQSDGKKAWERLLELKQQAEDNGVPIFQFVDIIVSDIEMPVMDGHNFTKRVKEDPTLKELPVILFSSLITEALRHKGKSVGADEQISKPEIEFLAETIKRLVQTTREQGF